MTSFGRMSQTPWWSTIVSQECRLNTFPRRRRPLYKRAGQSTAPNYKRGCAFRARPDLLSFYIVVASLCGTCLNYTAEKRPCSTTVFVTCATIGKNHFDVRFRASSVGRNHFHRSSMFEGVGVDNLNITFSLLLAVASF